jgi:hypothetical protein
VHPFLLSHEEKRHWLELSMGGGYGWSWSFNGGAMGELTGEGREGEGVGQGGMATRGARGEGGLLWRSSERGSYCGLPGCAFLFVRRKKERRERKKEKREKEKKKRNGKFSKPQNF